MKRNIAIVLAGGTGSRMGADIPKQFLKFAGRTVLEHSVEAFEHHPDIDEVAVVVHPDYHAEVLAMAKRRGWKKLGRLVESGPTPRSTPSKPTPRNPTPTSSSTMPPAPW